MDDVMYCSRGSSAGGMSISVDVDATDFGGVAVGTPRALNASLMALRSFADVPVAIVLAYLVKQRATVSRRGESILEVGAKLVPNRNSVVSLSV